MVVKILKVYIFISILFSQEIQVTVDKNNLSESQTFNLNIEVSNVEDFPELDISPIKKDFEIISGPSQQTNIQWINNKMSSTKTITWRLSPSRVGLLVIPSLNGTLGKNKFVTNPIRINVEESKNSDKRDVFIVAEIDKSSAYIGEQITLKYKLYKKSDISLASIDQFKMPTFTGFWTEELFTPQRLQYQKQDVILDGVKYQVASLGERALFPMTSNEKHQIPSVSVKIQMEIKKKRQRRDPFFDPFFNSFFSETKTKILKSKKKSIDIKGFPSGRPSDFTGAVGLFKLSSNVDRNNVDVNEGVAFNVVLEGTGNIGLFSLPQFEFPESIEVFSPTKNFERDNFRNQITGKQVWEYILLPRNKGEYTLPSVTMTYLDLKSKTWKKLNTKPIILTINSSKIQTRLIDGKTRDDIDFSGKDIRYLHSKDSQLIEDKKAEHYSILFIYASALMLLLTPNLIIRANGYRYLNKTKWNSKGALRKSLRLLKNNKNNVFQTANSAFYDYLQLKLDLPSSNLDSSKVKDLLKTKISNQTLEDLIHILTICDEGIYSPYHKIEESKIITQMQDIMKIVNKELDE